MKPQQLPGCNHSNQISYHNKYEQDNNRQPRLFIPLTPRRNGQYRRDAWRRDNGRIHKT